MPNWKKLIVSGSDALLNSLNVTNDLTVSGDIAVGSSPPSSAALGVDGNIKGTGYLLLNDTNNQYIYASPSGRTVEIYASSSVTSGDPAFRIRQDNATKVDFGWDDEGTSEAFIWNYSNGGFKIGTNSTERFKITAAGDVGIGTSTPGNKLDVEGNVQANNFKVAEKIIHKGDAHTFINFTSDTIAFDTGGSTVLTLDSSQNVNATGTISGSDVYINDWNSVSASLSTHAQSLVNNINGSGTADYVARFSDADTLTTGIIQDDGSSVGINAGPSSKMLYVNGTGQFTGELFVSHLDIIGSGGNSRIRDDIQLKFGTNRVFGIQYKSSGDYLEFTSGSNNLVTLLGNGNVGIGTTSPDRDLHVKASAIVSTKLEGTHAGHLLDLVNSNASPTYNGIRFTQGTANKMAVTHIADGTTKGYVQIGNSWAAGSEILVVDGRTSRVGIGTTSPTAELQVAGDVIVDGTITAQEFHTEFVSASIIYESGSTKFGDTSEDVHSFSGSLRVTGSGDHYFTDGNVGIGTSTPSGLLNINTGASGTYDAIILSRDTYGEAGVIKQSAGGLEVYSQKNLVLGADEDNTYTGGSSNIIFKVDSSEYARIDSGGNLQLNSYGSGNKTGTLAYTLGVDSSGKIIEFSGGSGGSVSSITNGADNRVAIFNGTDSLEGDANLTFDGDIFAVNTDELYVSGSRVGIGTSSPSSTLDVNGGAEINGETYIRSTSNVGLRIQTTDQGIGGADGLRVGLNATHAFVWQYENKPLAFATNGGQRMTISAAGNVGIGTTSPSTKLHLTDTTSGFQFTADTGTAGDGRLNIGHFANGTFIGTYGDDGGVADILRFGTHSGDERMRISSGGNVGIGTTNPIYKLQIAGSTYVNGGTLFLDTNQFLKWGNSNQGIKAVNDGNMSFLTGGSEKMTLTSSGNVGIGTTSPSHKLSINSGVTNVVATFKSSDNQAWISVQDDDSGTYGALFGTDTDAGHDIVLANKDATKRLVIDGNGNVGIGTTSPGAKLDINGIPWVNPADGTHSGWNFRQGGVFKGWVGYVDNNDVVNLSMDGSITNGINVNASHNVGIGTTSPASKLEVQTGYIISSGSGAADLGFVLDRAGLDTYHIRHLDGGLTIYNNTNNRKEMTFDGAGKVGIGTSTPQRTLDVNGEIQNNGIFRKGGNVIIKSTGSETMFGPGGSGIITFHNSATMTSGDETVRIDANGNLLLNNTSAGARLDIREDTNYAIRAEDGTGHYFRVNTGGDVDMRGDLVVQGTITAQEFHTEFVSASIIHDSGSTKFGDTLDDNHDFTGSVNVSGSMVLTDNTKLQLGSNSTAGDLRIFHTGTVSKIVNNTGNLEITQFVDDGDIIFNSDDGSGGVAEYLRLDGGGQAMVINKNLRAVDNVRIDVGGSTDGRFFHDGTDTHLKTLTGDLIIANSNDDGDIIFQSDDGSGGVTSYFRLDGSDSMMKAHKKLRFLDSVQLTLGNADDLQIYHDGTNSVLNNTTGNLQIYNNADDGDIQFISDNGSGGTAEYLRLDGGATKTIVSKAFQFFDSVKAEFGDSSDLQIWHDGSNSYVSDTGTGSLILTGTDLQLKSAGDEFYMYGAADGQVALYHNGTKKFETTSTGITVIGDIDADDITIDDWGSVSASLSAIQTAGGVNGTGTANTIPKWSDSDTLTDSYLTQPSATTLKLSSDGSATAGTILELHFPNNNTTDRCATINFTNNVGGYAAIEGGTTGANNTGYIGFKVDNAGTQNEAMRIIGSGNVGIGTTSPGKELHVAGEISGSAIQVIGGSSTNKFYSTNTGAIAEFRPSDTRSGMQPIFLYRGTASGTANYMLANGPSTFFGVYDSGVPGDASGMVRITPNNSSEAPAVRIGDAGSNGAYLDVGGNIKLLNNGSSYINGGNVGIGDTGPLTKLHVKVNDTAGTKSNYGKLLVEDTDAQLDLLSTSDGSWGSAINFIEAAGSSANTDVWSIARQTTGGTGDSSLHINFGTNNQHNNANKFKLDTSGNITIPGGLTIGDSNADTAQIGLKHLLGYCENTDVDTGTEDIKSLPLATYQAVFFDYVVKNGTNLRAGTVTAVHDGTNVEFTDTSTKDLGDTSAVTLSVDISGTNMRLRATTTSDNWIVKANIRGIKV